MEKSMMNDKKIVTVTTGCLGLVFGAALGAVLGVYSSYAIAELFTASREKQAYLTITIIPAIALLGALSVSATALGVVTRKKVAVILAGLGWGLLTLVLVKGLMFHHISRPSEFRVENQTQIMFQNVFVGGDFRQSHRVGNIAPGETSDAVIVDLDQPPTYNQLEGRAGAGYVRYRDASKSLTDGNYTYVVREEAEKLTYELRRD
jgi:hypothetical protein